MSNYRLKYQEDGIGPAKEIEFIASDPARALFIAQSEALGRYAELWQDGERVCTLRWGSPAAGVWEINGRH